jgi:hypothetical protein
VNARTAGLSGWIISDGKIGNEVQTRGVFDALGLDYVVKRVQPKGIWHAMSPWGPVSPGERFGTAASQFHPPWPQFAISIGRLTTPYLRKVRRSARFATYAVILQDPKITAGAADLFWVPQHDRRRGANVITTLTAPHSFSPERLRDLRAHVPQSLSQLPSPRVAVLLGGPNGDYHYTAAALERLASALRSLVALGAGLMITPSRRTPADITAFVRAVTATAGCFFWDGENDNPYQYFLAHADMFISPADSVNMTGEPCATGRPVYVFEPDGGSAKFTRFHQALRQHGATRPLPDTFERLESWTYEPLNSSATIAKEITRRWLQRRNMLGALTQSTK